MSQEPLEHGRGKPPRIGIGRVSTRWRHPVVLLTVGLLVFVGFMFWFGSHLNHSFTVVGDTLLRGVTRAWNEAGQPEGEALRRFMADRPYAVVSNRVFVIEGTNYTTQFATTHIGRRGTLFITTNSTVILWEGNRPPRIFRRETGWLILPSHSAR